MVEYTLEEPSFFYTNQMGSAVHAQTLKAQGVELVLMICLEMIGYFPDEPNSQKFPMPELAQHYPDIGNFICLVGRVEEAQLVAKMQSAMRGQNEADVQVLCAPTAFLK
ncbi:hypothetical protein [Eisenibacter elegans]|uniref:hypothetical protein n=1 Tax=Eisenibacter elegans TaxID=997 RepID=UPI0003F897BA|nr:hypothetical protein [Eisenibacter elegans]